MSDSEMDLTPTKSAASYRSRSSNSSRSGTPKPTEPVSDCARRKQAMLRFKRHDRWVSEISAPSEECKG
ncbi:hypothetical protein TNCV_4068201 [Trichonephila clavipes]|nr:hypothetical protein TNCV_4068201 [Trichonephila clavipes]